MRSRLVRRGVVADLFIVGGAAMALAYDRTRVTRDVDAMFVPHGVVIEESRAVADELALALCRRQTSHVFVIEMRV